MPHAESKIRELISALDARKDEAIERTFKGVAKNFREVFAELVPGGKGELVMQRRHVVGGHSNNSTKIMTLYIMSLLSKCIEWPLQCTTAASKDVACGQPATRQHVN